MNKEEIMAKYQPRQLDQQIEFEKIMSQMNEDQAQLNHPFNDRLNEIKKKRELLNIQKQSINQQLSALSIEAREIESEKTAINRAYHAVKHEFIIMNPREQFIKRENQEKKIII